MTKIVDDILLVARLCWLSINDAHTMVTHDFLFISKLGIAKRKICFNF